MQLAPSRFYQILLDAGRDGTTTFKKIKQCKRQFTMVDTNIHPVFTGILGFMFAHGVLPKKHNGLFLLPELLTGNVKSIDVNWKLNYSCCFINPLSAGNCCENVRMVIFSLTITTSNDDAFFKISRNSDADVSQLFQYDNC